MNIIPEPDWEIILTKLIKNKGIILLIGASDTGKTCLSKYLLKELLSQNINTCLVDSDIGQSSLGLAGTICMKIFQNLIDLNNFYFDKMLFIGSVNASEHVPSIISGTKRMVDMCKCKAEATIIDTTGFVSGEAGKKLKLCKINEIKPDHIIAIQRGNELEHILNEVKNKVKNFSINRISVSSSVNVRIRNREERVRYRVKKLESYFARDIAKKYILNIKDVKCLYNDEYIDISDKFIIKGAVIGLNNNEDAIALGKFIERDSDSITLRSPIGSLKAINRLVFGNLII